MEMRQLSSPIDIKGFSVITNNHTEFSPQGKIPTLWQRFDNSIAVDYKGGERVYGVYFNYESDHSGDFSVLAGFDGDSVPEHLKIEHITIPAGKYLVFRDKVKCRKLPLIHGAIFGAIFHKEVPSMKGRFQ